MAIISKKVNLAVGLFIDGRDVKFVCLDKHGNRIRLRDYKTVPLVTKLDESKYPDADLDEFSLDSGEDAPFDLGEKGEGGKQLNAEDNYTNRSVIRGLLEPYAGLKFAITYAITEPAIEYHILETDFGLTGKKLHDRIVEELGNVRSVPPYHDAVSFFQTGTGALITIVREDGTTLADLIYGLKDDIGQRVPNIPLIDAAEVALMNAVRLNYRFEPDDHTLVVYVGQEFTRLVFMRGMEYQHFAPVIAEGIESVNIQNTIYSRAILEQDNIGIRHLDRIILAGDAHRIELREFFKSKFSISDIYYMRFDSLDTGEFPADTVDKLSEFAVPIATAWKGLESGHPLLYPTNVIPKHLVKEQNVLRIAWHGYLLLVLIFLATLFFAVQIPEQQRLINSLAEEIAFKETQVLEVEQLEASIAGVRNDIRRFETALQLYEELTPAYDRWSKTFTHLSTGVGDLNSLWLLDVSSTGDHGRGLEINGYSIYRSRIPRFANLFENAILQEVTVQEIRERIVYRFKVLVRDTGHEIRRRPPDQIPAAAEF